MRTRDDETNLRVGDAVTWYNAKTDRRLYGELVRILEPGEVAEDFFDGIGKRRIGEERDLPTTRRGVIKVGMKYRVMRLVRLQKDDGRPRETTETRRQVRVESGANRSGKGRTIVIHLD
jgi:hypothetical protein